MNCCNFTMPDCVREPSVNEKVLAQIMQLPDGLRKEVRLLAKQYEILEVCQEPPVMEGYLIVREQPYIVKYKHFGYGGEEFEWTIDADKMH